MKDHIQKKGLAGHNDASPLITVIRLKTFRL